MVCYLKEWKFIAYSYPTILPLMSKQQVNSNKDFINKTKSPEMLQYLL